MKLYESATLVLIAPTALVLLGAVTVEGFVVVVVVLGRGGTAVGPLSTTTTTTIGRTRKWHPKCAARADRKDNVDELSGLVALSSSSSSSPSSACNSSVVAEFGDVVPLRPKQQSSNHESIKHHQNPDYFPPSIPETAILTPSSSSSSVLDLDKTTTTTTSYNMQRRSRNVLVAVLSIGLAVTNWLWQFTHPVSPIQLLYEMQQSSAPVTLIGNNDKPTVVDFWAPWCDNCKRLAPILYQMEQEYKNQINFIVFNGDDWEQNAPYIDAFGVDAIPHLALIHVDGTVETALIGPIPKHVLQADLTVLLENAAAAVDHDDLDHPPNKKPLPYTMLDVFANNPNGRKVHFEE